MITKDSLSNRGSIGRGKTRSPVWDKQRKQAVDAANRKKADQEKEKPAEKPELKDGEQ